jgi:hypothetical protein
VFTCRYSSYRMEKVQELACKLEHSLSEEIIKPFIIYFELLLDAFSWSYNFVFFKDNCWDAVNS